MTNRNHRARARKRANERTEDRELNTDGSPLITVEQCLITEVERLEWKLEAARADLRRWRMSHAE